MTELFLGLMIIAASEYDRIAASFWLTWYRIRYSTARENPLDSVPKPIAALLPYLKWVMSLIVVVVTSLVTAGLALPAWAVLLSAVSSSVLVWLASNNLGQAKVVSPEKKFFSPEDEARIRERLDSLHGPAVRPVTPVSTELPPSSEPPEGPPPVVKVGV